VDRSEFDSIEIGALRIDWNLEKSIRFESNWAIFERFFYLLFGRWFAFEYDSIITSAALDYADYF
jgi:hypothetical protein